MRSALTSLLLAVAAPLVPVLASAQSVVSGTWSGSVTDPSGKAKSVTYKVTRTQDTPSISLFDPTGSPVAFTDIREAGDTLLFNLAAGRQGARLVCKLLRQTDGAYEGTCSDPVNRQGRMRMVPPPKE